MPKDDLNSKPIVIQGSRTPKEVTTPLYKDGQLNFVLHHSLNIHLEEYDNRYGIFIWPGFIFTEDGIKRIVGEHASKLAIKYLKPIYNYNLNKKYLLDFWKYFLTNDVFLRPKEKWFENFYLKSIEEVEIPWASKTIERTQTRLGKN